MRVRNLFAIFLLTTLISCSSILPAALGALGNRGTSVDAQVGQNNTKQIVASQTTITARDGSQVDVSRPKVRSENLDSVVINETNNTLTLLLVAFAVVGWLLPSPAEIGRWFKNLFRKKS